jgi:hypothetical protein
MYKAVTLPLALVLIALIPTTSTAKCSLFGGTADGWNKRDASEGARTALGDAIGEWMRFANVARVSVTAMRPKPEPYWRDAVSAELFLKPDVVTEQSHTICWKGVVSPVVCTSGAKVCW